MAAPPTLDEVRQHRDDIERLAARRRVSNVRVFGSVAKRTAHETIDIDFFVDPEPGCSGFDLGGLYSDPEQLLQRRIDLVTPKAVHWYIRVEVIGEAVEL